MAEASLPQYKVSKTNIFKGTKFWLSQRVPQRSRFVDEIADNGGFVVPIEKQADYRIVDHARKEQIPGTYSYRFIDLSVRHGVMQDPTAHLVGSVVRPAVDNSSAATSARPARSARVPFTAADDQILWRWVKQCEAKSLAVKGNTIYKELEALHPHHTYQSWRERYIKHLIDRPNMFPPVGSETQSSNASPSVSSIQSQAHILNHTAQAHTLSPSAPVSTISNTVSAKMDAHISTSIPPSDEHHKFNDKSNGPPHNAPSFDDDDISLLITEGDQIMAMSTDRVAEAWDYFAEKLDDNQRSGAQWRKLWEEKGLARYLAMNTSQRRLNMSEEPRQAQAAASQVAVSASPKRALPRQERKNLYDLPDSPPQKRKFNIYKLSQNLNQPSQQAVASNSTTTVAALQDALKRSVNDASLQPARTPSQIKAPEVFVIDSSTDDDLDNVDPRNSGKPQGGPPVILSHQAPSDTHMKVSPPSASPSKLTRGIAKEAFMGSRFAEAAQLKTTVPRDQAKLTSLDKRSAELSETSSDLRLTTKDITSGQAQDHASPLISSTDTPVRSSIVASSGATMNKLSSLDPFRSQSQRNLNDSQEIGEENKTSQDDMLISPMANEDQEVPTLSEPTYTHPPSTRTLQATPSTSSPSPVSSPPGTMLDVPDYLLHMPELGKADATPADATANDLDSVHSDATKASKGASSNMGDFMINSQSEMSQEFGGYSPGIARFFSPALARDHPESPVHQHAAPTRPPPQDTQAMFGEETQQPFLDEAHLLDLDVYVQSEESDEGDFETAPAYRGPTFSTSNTSHTRSRQAQDFRLSPPSEHPPISSPPELYLDQPPPESLFLPAPTVPNMHETQPIRFSPAASPSATTSQADSVNQTASMLDELDRWIKSFQTRGFSPESTEAILRATSLDVGLADEVIERLIPIRQQERESRREMGLNEDEEGGVILIPDDWKGVWTVQDDAALQSPDGRLIQRVEGKHGRASMAARFQYLHRLEMDD